MDDDKREKTVLDSVVDTLPSDARQTVKADASAAVGEARDALDTIKKEGSEQFAAIKETAQEQVADAGETVKSFAADQKDAAGDQLAGVANALSTAADELQRGDQAAVAGYARDLAGGLKQASETVKSRNVDEIVAMAEDFGRSQPLAFLGAAALAGFVASRFMLSSAQRRQGTTSPAAAPHVDTSAGAPAAVPANGGGL